MSTSSTSLDKPRAKQTINSSGKSGEKVTDQLVKRTQNLFQSLRLFHTDRYSLKFENRFNSRRLEPEQDVVAIPSHFERYIIPHAAVVISDERIQEIGTTVVWLNFRNDYIKTSDQLVHWLLVMGYAPIPVPGKNFTIDYRKDLLELAQKVRTKFDAKVVKGMIELDDVRELALFAQVDELAEEVMASFQPHASVFIDKGVSRRNLNEGLALVMKYAHQIDANTLDTLLHSTFEQIEHKLRSVAAPEAREEFVSIIYLCCAILDQMVDQGVHPTKPGRYQNLLTQIQNIKKDHGLGEKNIHWFKKKAYNGKVTPDDEILYYAVYAQQGLAYLTGGKENWLKKGKNTLGSLIDLSLDIAEVATAQKPNPIDGIKVGMKGLAIIFNALAKCKGKHAWYPLIRSISNGILYVARDNDVDKLNELLDEIDTLAKESKFICRIETKKNLFEKEAYSWFLFGFIDALADGVVLTSSKTIKEICVKRLCDLFGNHVSRIANEEENYIDSSEEWGNHVKVTNRALYQLQALLSHPAQSGEENIGIWQDIRSILSRGDAELKKWKGALDTRDKWDNKKLTDAFYTLKSQFEIWENEDAPMHWGPAFKKMWEKLDPRSFKNPGLKTFQRIKRWYIKKTEGTEQTTSIEEYPFRLLEISTFIDHLMKSELRWFNQETLKTKGQYQEAIEQSRELQKAAFELQLQFYHSKLAHAPFVKAEVQRMLIRIVKLCDESIWGSLRNSIGHAGYEWLKNLKIYLKDINLIPALKNGSLFKLLNEIPWVHSNDSIEQAFYWDPVEHWVVKALINRLSTYFKNGLSVELQESRNQILHFLNDHQPDINFRPHNGELIAWALQNPRKEDEKPQDMHVGRVSLLEEIMIDRFPYKRNAKNIWREIEIVLGHFVKPLFEKQFFDSYFQNFILSPQQRILLILGDPGSGKSVVARKLSALCAENEENKFLGYIPIFVLLREVKDPKNWSIDEVFSHISSSELKKWKREKKFLFFCDGFDEMRDKVHLYSRCGFDEWVESKFVFTCRSELEELGGDIRQYFLPDTDQYEKHLSLLSKIVLEKFSVDQRKEFLKEYLLKQSVSTDQGDIDKKVTGMLTKISDWELSDLTFNPFILRALVDILPQTQLEDENRAHIYELFIEKRLREDAQRAASMLDFPPTVDDLRKFSKGLALFMLQGGRNSIRMTDRINVESGSLFNGLEDLDKIIPRIEKSAAFRSYGSMISSHGEGFYGFMHQTIFEYFVARALVDDLLDLSYTLSGIVSDKERHEKEVIQESLINISSIGNEPVIIEFILDMFENMSVGKKDRLLKLLKVILKRSGSGISDASSNALTVLNLVGHPFTGNELDRICAPKANLTFGMLDQVNMVEAKVEDANLDYAFFNEKVHLVTLNRGCFGESIFVHGNVNIKKIIAVSKGGLIAFYDKGTGDSVEGTVKIIDKEENEKLKYGVDNKKGSVINVWGHSIGHECVIQQNLSWHQFKYNNDSSKFEKNNLFTAPPAQELVGYHSGGFYAFLLNKDVGKSDDNDSVLQASMHEWKKNSWNEVAHVNLRHPEEKLHAYQPNCSILVTVTEKHQRLYNVFTRKYIDKLSLPMDSKPDIHCSYDGQVVANLSQGKVYIQLLSLDKEEASNALPGPVVLPWENCTVFAFSNNKPLLAIGNSQGNVAIYDCVKLKLLYMAKLHDDRITSFCFADDKKCLYVGDERGYVSPWNFSTNISSKYFGLFQQQICATKFVDKDESSLLQLESAEGNVWETNLSIDYHNISKCFNHEGIQDEQVSSYEYNIDNELTLQIPEWSNHPDKKDSSFMIRQAISKIQDEHYSRWEVIKTNIPNTNPTIIEQKRKKTMLKWELTYISVTKELCVIGAKNGEIYLYLKKDKSFKVFHAHITPINYIRVSKGSTFITTKSQEGTLIVWKRSESGHYYMYRRFAPAPYAIDKFQTG